MRKRSILAFAIVIAVAVVSLILPTGCAGDNHVAVPRPKGYPRQPQIGDVYIAPEGAPAGFVMNSDARLVESSDSTRSGEWITVEYPMYDATVYYTFSPVTPLTADGVLENRLERMRLNFAGVPISTRPIKVNGKGGESGSYNMWDGQIMTTREKCAFPVQFILRSPDMIVSGSLFMPSMTVNPDSVAPAVEIITRDIERSVSGLYK